jgi:acetylornithine deacetylase
VDSVAQLRLTRELIDIDSTTGQEGDVASCLARALRGLGYAVVEQPLDRGRCNVIATIDDPVMVFSTHFDCVPPFFPSREEGGRLFGRGACDAKGILVAQIAAAERLRRAGETRVGLVFVAGEERGSDGAKAANALAPATCRYLVNGEPTDNRLALGTRGAYRVRLTAHGRAAHSSLPELGISAIDKLVDALMAARGIAWPTDPVLGRSFYSVGLIAGGVAPNVIPPKADAEMMFRTVGPSGELRDLLQARIGSLVTLDNVLVVPPVKLTTRPGFETAVFSFTTDIPFLERWGAPLLIGPGSVTVAHTDEEHAPMSELYRAVDLYESLARQLLSGN